MIFVLDNYDSFTYNLVQYIGEMGHEVVVRRNDQTTLEEIETLGPDLIVISPAPCTPPAPGEPAVHRPQNRRHSSFRRQGAYLRCVSRPSGNRRRVRRERDPSRQP